MTLKLQILVLQAIFALAVLAMAGIAWLAAITLTDRLERVAWSNAQLATALHLSGRANRHAEQLAEWLLVGASQEADIESAGAQVIAAIDRLQALGADELASIEDPQERRTEAFEAERLGHLRAVFEQIDAAMDSVRRRAVAGDRDGAIVFYNRTIEQRLDAELDRLIDDVVSDEGGEVERVNREASALARRLMLSTLVALAAIIAASTLLGIQFYRTIVPPLHGLTQAARAIESGDLTVRVAVGRMDELGQLALRFNQMAEELGRQRERLQSARDELEREVSARTLELAETNRRLTALDRQRVCFLAEISHELRTPLTVLRGEAEVALRGAARPVDEYRSALAQIADLAGTMGRLVEDLLALARSESDDMHFEPVVARIEPLVASALRDAELLSRGRSVGYVPDPEAHELSARVDVRRLRQVLVILLDNALKHTPPGTPVDVRVGHHDGQVEVSVVDRGAGIPRDELPFVFEPFYRGQAARGRSDDGSGVGLAVARRIVEKLGGTLDLDSEPGRGTTATLRLPARVAA